jgi:hypothetical protein
MINSFSVVATQEVWREAAILIFTLRSFHEQPIYILCDSETSERLSGFNFSEVHFDIDADPLILKNTSYNKDTVKNDYHRPDCIAKKMDCLERATLLFGNTLFLDADIVVVDSLEDITHPVMVSPHYHVNDPLENKKTYGAYNAGYLFNSEPDLPQVWRSIYNGRSKFFEQEGMVYFHEKFDVGKFKSPHNVGFWRHPVVPGVGMVTGEEELPYIKSFHAHLTEDLFERADPGLKRVYRDMMIYVMDYLAKRQPKSYKFVKGLHLTWEELILRGL